MVREKDTRVIHRGVTAPTVTFVGAAGKAKGTPTAKTYLPGEEDALERVLTDEQVLMLKSRGAIDGNWKAGGDKSEPAKAAEPVKDAPTGGKAPDDHKTPALTPNPVEQPVAPEANDSPEASAEPHAEPHRKHKR